MRKLSDMMPGQTAVIYKIPKENALFRRFRDIGLIENTKIECVGQSPLGNPKAYLIRGAVIAIRLEDCADILIMTESWDNYGVKPCFNRHKCVRK